MHGLKKIENWAIKSVRRFFSSFVVMTTALAISYTCSIEGKLWTMSLHNLIDTEYAQYRLKNLFQFHAHYKSMNCVVSMAT